MAVQTEKQARTAVQAQEQARTSEASTASTARWLLRRTSRLAGWLLLAAAALPVWPLAIVTAAGYAAAWLRRWPASRLGRQAGWTLPMTAVWIAAESARGWRALTLDPVRDGASGWPHLTALTVIRTFLLVAPVTIPAGLALAALLRAWRVPPLAAGDPAGIPGARAGAMRVTSPVRHLPGRIRRGRPLRLLACALAAGALALAVLHLVAGQPAAPALVTGVTTWFLLTARADLAPPPETARAAAPEPDAAV